MTKLPKWPNIIITMKDTNNTFPSNIFNWDISDKDAAIELSTLNGLGFKFHPRTLVTVESTRTGAFTEFEFVAIDWADPSHEDIAGWRYAADINGQRWELIFIND